MTARNQTPAAWVALALFAGAAAVTARRVERLVVDGDSMAPTLLPGDRLLALRTARVRPGDIVTAVDPRAGERLLLKRVLGVEETSGSVNLQGDNPASSTDSRHFGPVDAESIRSRIVYRYAPDSRACRLGRRGVTTSRRTRW